jgi:lysyl-tRNA synthetase class 2
MNLDKLRSYSKSIKMPYKDSWGVGKVLLEIFEKSVEANLIQPTFVTEYPVEVSPLSRRNNENPSIADRFELFIGGKEIANGFCELNDPDDQAERFKEQVKAKADGDDEAMGYDEDYITALEHGMPPAVGVGVGVDRLVMMLTNQSSIRDVILFPQLKS